MLHGPQQFTFWKRGKCEHLFLKLSAIIAVGYCGRSDRFSVKIMFSKLHKLLKLSSEGLEQRRYDTLM